MASAQVHSRPPGSSVPEAQGWVSFLGLILLAGGMWLYSQSWRGSRGSRGCPPECAAHPGDKATHGRPAIPRGSRKPPRKVASVPSCHHQPAPLNGGVAGGKGALQEEGLPWSGVRTAPQRKGWWDPCRLQDEGDSRQVGRREGPRLREQPGQGVEAPLRGGGWEGPGVLAKRWSHLPWLQSLDPWVGVSQLCPGA